MTVIAQLSASPLHSTTISCPVSLFGTICTRRPLEIFVLTEISKTSGAATRVQIEAERPSLLHSRDGPAGAGPDDDCYAIRKSFQELFWKL